MSPLLVGLVVVAVAGWVIVSELASPGPSRLVTAVRRYGWWPYLTAAGFVVFGLVCLARPGWRSNIVSLVVLAAPVAAVANHRLRLLRRASLRGRWPSVARSCGLGVLRDIRGRQWPFDATVTLGNEHVEYLPVISRPRAVAGVGVVYRLTPARGSTIEEVAKASEALAAGLRVRRVEVTRHRADRGELLAVWR